MAKTQKVPLRAINIDAVVCRRDHVYGVRGQFIAYGRRKRGPYDGVLRRNSIGMIMEYLCVWKLQWYHRKQAMVSGKTLRVSTDAHKGLPYYTLMRATCVISRRV